ncbi:MAG: hypothetical protein VW870_14875, partial [Rhodobiaceae bacterium]
MALDNNAADPIDRQINRQADPDRAAADYDNITRLFQFNHSSLLANRSGTINSSAFHDANIGANGRDLALRHQYFEHCSGGRCFDLACHFFGFHFIQRVTGFKIGADRHMPFGDSAFFHVHANSGEFKPYFHAGLSPSNMSLTAHMILSGF